MTQNQWLNKTYLLSQIDGVLRFYHQHSIQEAGGFHQYLTATGEHGDNVHHLVSSTRIVVNFARGMILFGKPEYEANVRHGLAFIRNQHRWQNGQGYNWLMLEGEPQDQDQYCYGYAFLILAYANALHAGINEAGEWLEETFSLMEKYFWQAQHGLYADQLSADLQTLDRYRGQNANMHACEAMIAAFEATKDKKFLDRAELLAYNITVRATQDTDGLLWEHYTTDWQVDWDYNKDDPQNLYKPWGFQPGHFTEWSKLLLMVNKHRPNELLARRAKELMDMALEHSWDSQYGGLLYGFDPQYAICDDNKLFWVQAETLAALAWLMADNKDRWYMQSFDELAAYIENHFIVSGETVWRRRLRRDNQHQEKWIAEPGAKCDYHNLGACYDILRVA